MMHSASLDLSEGDPGDVLVALAALVTEGRTPRVWGKAPPDGSPMRGFQEGPHCYRSTSWKEHRCNVQDAICLRYSNVKTQVLAYWQKCVPICIEVLTQSNCCKCGRMDEAKLMERWCLNVSGQRRSHNHNIEGAAAQTNGVTFNINQLIGAIRSQLHFSQISAWFSSKGTASAFDVLYRLTIPGETYGSCAFTAAAQSHHFPAVEIALGFIINVSLQSLPRSEEIPQQRICAECSKTKESGFFDDRMHTTCTLKGKHRCDDELFQESCASSSANDASEGSTSTSKGKHRCFDLEKRKGFSLKLDKGAGGNLDLELSSEEVNEVLSVLQPKSSRFQLNDLSSSSGSKGDILLDAILRSCNNNNNNNNNKEGNSLRNSGMNDDVMNSKCDNNWDESADNNKPSVKDNIYVDVQCDRRILHRSKINRKITFSSSDEENGLLSFCSNNGGIPSASEKAKFRKNLDSAASMVFHSRTGLPLTSSPAPVRRGKSCFDFDSSINSVSAIRSALFSLAQDEDSESDCSIVSPCSPDYSTSNETPSDVPLSKYRHRKGQAANLLGSFEESVLNGRLEPDSTVHGFTAELGASGSFVPRHLVVPVTVFFYTLGDSSSPYLGHINLGKKGYNVPKSGTVQVTLFNPLRTVVKMFVIMYDLNDMPANSQTFIRQRTLYMPISCAEPNIEWGQKWLRYLIHLRFMSSKSGRIYLHSDIRMIIFRKSDLDTAAAHGLDMSYELRSFTHTPSNPKYSPRK